MHVISSSILGSTLTLTPLAYLISRKWNSIMIDKGKVLMMTRLFIPMKGTVKLFIGNATFCAYPALLGPITLNPTLCSPYHAKELM